MNRSLPGRWGREGLSGKREEDVHRVVLNTLQAVHRRGRIGDTAGEMGRDVRGLERHSKQLLSRDPEGNGETFTHLVLSCLGTWQLVSFSDKYPCPQGVYSLKKAVDNKQNKTR